MTENFIAVEQRLIQGYQAQLQHYELALHAVAQSTLDAVGSAERAQKTQHLNKILRDIAALDAALAEDKTVWRFSGHRPGPQLRTLLDAVAERIRTLSAIVDGRVAELQASKQALVPAMDECIQQRKMLNAYGKSR